MRQSPSQSILMHQPLVLQMIMILEIMHNNLYARMPFGVYNKSVNFFLKLTQLYRHKVIEFSLHCEGCDVIKKP